MNEATGDAYVVRLARSARHDGAGIGVLLLAAASTVMMLQATRVFLSYMVFIIDQSERLELGVTAGAVYLSIALGAILPRVAGIRRTMLLLTVGMVAARCTLQVWTEPDGRMWLGAATIVLAGWLLPGLLFTARSTAAYGVGVGLALDVALRVGRDTLDLPFSPTVAAHAATLVIGVVALLGALMIQRADASAPSTGLAVSALTFGPALALHHLTIGNLGTVQLRLDDSLATSAWLLSVGIIGGLAIDLLLAGRVVGKSARGRAIPAVTTIGLILAGGGGLLAFWNDSSGAGIVGLVAGTASTVALIVGALRGGEGHGGVAATALWLTLGMILHAALLFAYFTATGLPVLIVVLFSVVALGALLEAWRPREERSSLELSTGSLGIAAAALVLASLVVTVGASTPQAGEPLPGEFTVMTYNIQAGFSQDNHWDLERIAEVIEASEPDVVILQEVGRGWPILSAVDEAHWLSQRLGMQLVWGPASQDDLWGNAILTTAPMTSTAWVKFDTTQNLRRGAVLVELETEAGPVTVIGTHLDNPGGATSARQEQIAQLLELRGGVEPAIVAGDLNADPDSDAILTILGDGFSDTGAAFGPDAVTSDDARRIDYVLISPGLELVSAEIPDTWASDHRPVVITLRVGP